MAGPDARATQSAMAFLADLSPRRYRIEEMILLLANRFREGGTPLRIARWPFTNRRSPLPAGWQADASEAEAASEHQATEFTRVVPAHPYLDHATIEQLVEPTGLPRSAAWFAIEIMLTLGILQIDPARESWILTRRDCPDRLLNLHTDQDLRYFSLAFLTALIEGPLTWLGLAEIGRADDGRATFQVLPRAAVLADREVPQGKPGDFAPIMVGEDLTITARPGAAPELLAFLTA